MLRTMCIKQHLLASPSQHTPPKSTQDNASCHPALLPSSTLQPYLLHTALSCCMLPLPGLLLYLHQGMHVGPGSPTARSGMRCEVPVVRGPCSEQAVLLLGIQALPGRQGSKRLLGHAKHLLKGSRGQVLLLRGRQPGARACLDGLHRSCGAWQLMCSCRPVHSLLWCMARSATCIAFAGTGAVWFAMCPAPAAAWAQPPSPQLGVGASPCG